ncbi:MAG TPA: hypothetical protein PLI11_08960 [Clostridia bacterium]|nr:hypothetical protein [Clostridia bacterium]
MRKISLLIVALIFLFTLSVSSNDDITKNLNTNLTGLRVINGEWKSVENGVFGDNDGVGNCFMMSDVKRGAGIAFRYSAEISVDNVAGGIVFGVENPDSPEDIWYCMNIDAGNMDAPLVRLFKVDGTELVWSNNVVKHDYEKGQSYTLTIEVFEDGSIDFYVDDEYMASQADTGYEGGYLGIKTCVSSVTFNNINYEIIESTPTPEKTQTPEPSSTPVPEETEEKPKTTDESKPDTDEEDNTMWVVASIALGVVIVVLVVLIIIKKRK